VIIVPGSEKILEFHYKLTKNNFFENNIAVFRYDEKRLWLILRYFF
jgi:hypothetical protein